MLDAIRSMVGKRRETFGTKKKSKSEPKQNTSGLPKPYPSDAPEDMHRSYYTNNKDAIKSWYKSNGMELPEHFESEEDYVEYRLSQKAYGGRTQQPRGAYRSAEMSR